MIKASRDNVDVESYIINLVEKETHEVLKDFLFERADPITMEKIQLKLREVLSKYFENSNLIEVAPSSQDEGSIIVKFPSDNITFDVNILQDEENQI